MRNEARGMRETAAISSDDLSQEVVGIVRDWNNLAKRTQYEQRLQELGSTAVETLLALTREEQAANKKRARLGIFLMGCAVLVLILKFFQRKFYPSSGLELLLLLMQFAFQLTGMACLFFQPGRVAKVLADFDDIRIVGPLLETKFIGAYSGIIE